jgi:hypothetical protein
MTFADFADAKRALKRVYRKKKLADDKVVLFLKTGMLFLYYLFMAGFKYYVCLAVQCCKQTEKLEHAVSVEDKMKINESIADCLCSASLYQPAIYHYKKVVSVHA